MAAHAFLATPIYRTEALVTVADETSESSQGLGAVGALASLTGINLNGAANRRAEYLALLTSRQVIAELIQSEGLLPEFLPKDRLAGAQGGEIDPSIVNDAVTVFLSRVLLVNENVRSGLITIQIEWNDRFKAASWTNRIVALVNQRARQNALTEAKQTVEYLNRELAHTDLVTVREGIYRLIEANLSRAAIANGREQYALRIVDPAYIPSADKFVRPRRLLEPLVGLILGVVVGVFCAIIVGREQLWRADV